MLLILGRMILVRLMADPDVKKAVIDELKELAASTDSTWDDAAVKRVDEAWDILPTVFSRG